MTVFETDFKLCDKKKIDINATKVFFDKWSEKACFDKNQRLEERVNDYSETLEKMKSSFSRFGTFLKQIPMLIAIVYWIKEETNLGENIEKYMRSIDALLQNNILFLKKNGKTFTLADLKEQTHQEIIENIRCIDSLSLLEKEELVECYLRFSSSLERATFNFISKGFDPDRQRVIGKEIKYEVFLDFVQNLPPRDALIAKLLYFGAPSIDELLNLRCRLVYNSKIIFNGNPVSFPKHLFLNVKEYLINKKDKELVFTNLRGAIIERSHLNQSFARASNKCKSFKITPGLLLKIKSV